MLSAWNSTKNKLHHRYSDKNLHETFLRNILEDATERILLIVNLMVDLFKTNFQMEVVIVKMTLSSLSVMEIFCSVKNTLRNQPGN